MFARLLVILALVCAPSVAHAQRVFPRPTATEAAGAMLPCMAAMSSQRIEVVGDVFLAEITEGGMPTIILYRELGNPDDRLLDFQFWLDDDPVHPPMVLHFQQSKALYPFEARKAVTDCFAASYPRH